MKVSLCSQMVRPPSTTTISPENHSKGEMCLYLICDTSIAAIIAIMKAPVAKKIFSGPGTGAR